MEPISPSEARHDLTADEYIRRLESQIETLTASQRAAWEAGFALARSYGDNAVHFDGEQKERQWARYLETRPAQLAAGGRSEGCATSHEQCHDLVCNGDRRLPRGASGVSCSCKGRDAAYLKSDQAQARIAELEHRVAYYEAQDVNISQGYVPLPDPPSASGEDQ